MYSLILLPISLLSLHIECMNSVQVVLLNDNMQQDMVLFYNNAWPWPEFDEKTVSFPSNIFSYIPDSLTGYDLLSFQIIKKF